jgi:hypothetical protein
MLGASLTRDGLLFVVVLFAAPFLVYAADLSISPATETFGVGEEFKATVKIEPGSDSVNAADGTIAFDPALLSVVGISKEGSAFSLWTSEPAFSNSAGTINFSGGTPTAFSKSGTVIVVTFKGKKAGAADVSFSKGSILAADGKGTDVYKNGAAGTFTIEEKASEPEPVKEEPTSSGVEGEKPAAPTIMSSTHPKEDAWYSTSTATFSWQPPVDITAVRTTLSEKQDAEPKEDQDVDTVTRTIKDVKDGTWYFFVQFRNDFGWGEIAKRIIQIDTVPPLEFSISLVEEDTPKFSFNVQDELSGIERYEVVLGEANPLNVRAADVVDGTYPVPPQEGGQKKVTIRAYDKANNMREASADLTLPKVDKPSAKGAAEEAVPAPTWTTERILTILFALIIGALVSWMMYTRKIVEEQRMRILARIAEVADKNDRVFSAMREEFEQMINDLDSRPQLTPQERDFLEKVKEVLDISEELTDSGLSELKKLVRGQ